MTTLPPETRILVVDDGAAILALMHAFLKRLGFADVRLAATVDDGLRAFREQESDVVFLDLMIAGETGARFAEAAFAERPEATIVVMTAHPSTHADVTALVALGARDYLPKPIQLHRLHGVLAHLAEDIEDIRDAKPYEDDANTPDASYG